MTGSKSPEHELMRAAEHLAAHRYAEARQVCEPLLAAHPDEPEVLHLAGLVRFRQGEAEAAIDQLSRALDIKPDSADILANLGLMQQELGHDDAAAACFAAAADLAPYDLTLRGRLAHALYRMHDYPAAEAIYRDLIAKQPGSGELYNELGFVLRAQSKLDEALGAFRRASELRPDSRAAWNNLASLLLVYGRYREAADAHRRVLAVDPSVAPVTYLNIMSTMTYSDAFTPAERAAVAHEFATRCAAPIQRQARPGLGNSRDPDRRLRIGYVSSDLYDHPVAWNLEPLLAHHDRTRFDVVCYADVPEPDAMTARLRALVDGWWPIAGKSDEQVAAQIRADGIDVLLVVAGRLDRNRPLVTAYRPAPVQVSLFDTATSGLGSMDYLVADPVLVPRGTTEPFVERVLRLPTLFAYAPPPAAPDVKQRPAAAPGVVTFGSFHNPAKLSDEALRLWGDVLRALPGARLKLKYRNWFANEGLRRRVLTALGVDAARIDFATGDVPRAEYLCVYDEVDIALDPLPFTGATSTFEALWMGVPVITMLGETMAGRWSASLLRAVALDDLVMRTSAAYVSHAVSLATDPQRLGLMRATLRERVRRSPLCNGPQRARHLERAFRAIWRRWCGGP
jgi:predicted O-linked N-acetylglucosamine transferase (SPINDLY family)